jgi:hypothetical protein
MGNTSHTKVVRGAFRNRRRIPGVTPTKGLTAEEVRRSYVTKRRKIGDEWFTPTLYTLMRNDHANISALTEGRKWQVSW